MNMRVDIFQFKTLNNNFFLFLFVDYCVFERGTSAVERQGGSTQTASSEFASRPEESQITISGECYYFVRYYGFKPTQTFYQNETNVISKKAKIFISCT